MSDNIGVRDEIAKAKGWKPPGTPVPKTGNHYINVANSTITRSVWWRDVPGLPFERSRHPVPNTLDEAAQFPDGWLFSLRRSSEGKWFACAWLMQGLAIYQENKDDPKEALFPLLLECLKYPELVAKEQGR